MSFGDLGPLHRTLNIKIKSSGSYVDGRWVTSDDGTGTITGSIQPITGKALEALTDGRRDVGMINVFTDTKLNVSDQARQTKGDLVIHDSDEYEVVQRASWLNNIISHYHYIAEFRGPAS